MTRWRVISVAFVVDTMGIILAHQLQWIKLINFYSPAKRSEARWMFSVASVCLSMCLCICTITSERLNIGWSNLAVRCIVQKSCPSSNVKVKGQGHKGQKMRIALLMPLSAYEWYAIAVNSVQQQQTGPLRGCHGCYAIVSSASSMPVGKSAHDV